MSVFGKLFKGVRSKVDVNGLASGVGAQMKIGSPTQEGGNSGLFGGLFGGGKKNAKAQAVLAAKVQAQNNAMLDPMVPNSLGRYLLYAVVAYFGGKILKIW